MRTNALRGVVAGACLLWLAGAAQAAEKMPWAKSFDAAMATAKTTNKLIMADFFTDWCGWCKRLDADTYTDKKVLQLSAQFVPVKINAEKEGVAVAKKYGVEAYPTILFLNSAGEVEGRIAGYLPPGPFGEQLTQLAEAHKTFPALEARVKANPNDVEAVAKLAALHAGRGNGERATALLEQAEKSDPQNASGHLTKAYNAVGDHFQMKEDFDKAIPLFRKAAETGKDPQDLAYAHLSIASCYLSQKKLQEAIPELEATIAVPNAPENLKQAAQQLLDRVKKAAADGTQS